MSDPISRYKRECFNLARELSESLTTDDVFALQAELTEMGLDGWRQWEYANRESADAFLRAAPSKRSRRKAWKDPSVRRLLTLAAYRKARLAIAFLEATEHLNPGCSYRDMCADAAGFAFDVALETLWEWPFDEGYDPFR